MEKTTLHITNGSILTEKLQELDFHGEFLTWHEMLCEGPTLEHIDTDEFINIRSEFFDKTYDLEIDTVEFHNELNKLNSTEHYNEIILWFEYDLFCHINLVAVISLLQQKRIDIPLYLVCSGRIKGENDLKGLGELTSGQLLKHFKERIKLNNKDIDIATTVWGIYCGKNHSLLKPYIIKPSSFNYLSNCLKAHLERFPDSITGLNVLEEHILKTILDNDIKSKHHLLGYILNYQGFYGFGDIQIERIIESLQKFYNVFDHKLELNELGLNVINNHINVEKYMKSTMYYGGVKKNDFQFDKAQNKLLEK